MSPYSLTLQYEVYGQAPKTSSKKSECKRILAKDGVIYNKGRG